MSEDRRTVALLLRQIADDIERGRARPGLLKVEYGNSREAVTEAELLRRIEVDDPMPQERRLVLEFREHRKFRCPACHELWAADADRADCPDCSLESVRALGYLQ